MHHIRGQCRTQTTLFPEALEDLIDPQAPVRVIDAFIASLDLAALGFARAIPATTGRPGYDPADLLRLYVYGYLNRVRSSRCLERECARNVELMWLLNRLSPDFKTIADFRKDNAAALVGVCRAFTLFCRAHSLFGAELIAIDGSKFKAAASRKQVWTPKRLAKVQAALDARIAEYLRALDAADAAEASAPSGATEAALARLKAEGAKLQALATQMQQTGAAQLVVTEPEARLMRTAKEGYQVAYNVQTAVDAKHALIAAFEVTNDGNDHQQLLPMAHAARAALKAKTLTVIADTGYRNGEQAAQCEALGITAVVPAPTVVNPKGEDRYAKTAFTYDPAHDTYRCPAGETLTRYKTDAKQQTHYYTTRACRTCALRPACTKATQRSIARHAFEEWVERLDQRAKDSPELMKRRHALAEHPFGGLKHLLGHPRFLVRGLKNVKAEMALAVLGYNLKRVINLRGASNLIACWA